MFGAVTAQVISGLQLCSQVRSEGLWLKALPARHHDVRGRDCQRRQWRCLRRAAEMQHHKAPLDWSDYAQAADDRFVLAIPSDS